VPDSEITYPLKQLLLETILPVYLAVTMIFYYILGLVIGIQTTINWANYFINRLVFADDTTLTMSNKCLDTLNKRTVSYVK